MELSGWEGVHGNMKGNKVSDDSPVIYSTARLGIAEYRNDGNEGDFARWEIRGASRGPCLSSRGNQRWIKPVRLVKQMMSRAIAPPQFLSLAIPYALGKCPGRSGVTASPTIRTVNRLDRKRVKEDSDCLNDATPTASVVQGVGQDEAKTGTPGIVCSEIVKGRKRTYRVKNGEYSKGFETEEEKESQGQKFKAFLSGYLLPQGFPESVAPQYFDYMRWRGVQYLFGGAISVFTTR